MISFVWNQDHPAGLSQVSEIYPDVCVAQDFDEGLANCDAVIVTLRRASHHFEIAQLALQRHKPVFVDKPFTATVEEAHALMQLACQEKIPLTGGSTLCFLPNFEKLRESIGGSSCRKFSFRADPNSSFEGWRFYGSHLTDLVMSCESISYQTIDVKSADAQIFVELSFVGRTAVLVTTPDCSVPTIHFDEKVMILDDRDCYLWGMRHFLDVLAGKVSGRAPELTRSTKLMVDIEARLNASPHL